MAHRLPEITPNKIEEKDEDTEMDRDTESSLKDFTCYLLLIWALDSSLPLPRPPGGSLSRSRLAILPAPMLGPDCLTDTGW